jgi:hypothetical protein
MSLQHYDRYNPAKRYDRLLFLPRPLQAAELNELQSIIHDKIKNLADMSILDGTRIKGCDIIPAATYPGTIKIATGFLYFGGAIIEIPETIVTGNFQGTGVEYIYVRSTTTTITETEDPTLVDPQDQAPNYGRAGAYRTKFDIIFMSESNKTVDSVRFGFISDGLIPMNLPNFGGDKVVRVMETRTFDTSGDFMVSGGNITLKENAADSTKYDIMVEPYKVYLNGRVFSSKITQIKTRDKSNELRESQDFMMCSNSIGSDHGLTNNVFRMSGNYVEHVQTCSYPVRHTFSVQHWTIGGADTIGFSGSLAQVISVKQGQTTYVEVTSYNADYAQGKINWSPNGAEPGTGTTYQVDCVYYKTVNVANGTYDTTKYDVTYPRQDQSDYLVAQVIVTDPEWYHSNNNLEINPEYTAFKFRMDAVVIDKNTGIMDVITGNYASFPPLPYPKVQSNHYVLFLITLTPGNYQNPFTYFVDDRRTVRITQAGLNTMKFQLRTVQDSLSFTQLDADAASMPVTGIMSGIFTNQFNTMDKSDDGYDGSNPLLPNAYYAGFSSGALILPIIYATSFMDPTVQSLTAVSKDTIFINPYTDQLYLSQRLASRVMSINPYAIPYVDAILKINPPEDVWVDVNNIRTVNQNATITNVFETKEVNTVSLAPINNVNNTGHFVPDSPNSRLLSENFSSSVNIRTIGTSSTDRVETHNELFAVATNAMVTKYARQKTLTLSGTYWFVSGSPTSYTLHASISGVEVPFSATIQPDYSFSGTIDIPSGTIPSGTIPIKVWTDPTNISATANYVSSGMVITNKSESRPVTTVMRTNIETVGVQQVSNITRDWHDPLAESLLFDENIFISSIGIYFNAKGIQSSVTCELCEMDNGYPSQIKLVSKSLAPSQVVISGDGSAETKFTFDDPVFIKAGTEICIVLRSPDSNYTVFLAKQGENDIVSGNLIVSQPYPGVLFSSQNGSTWTAEQNMDLKFNVYSSYFDNTSKEIKYYTQTGINSSWMMIVANAYEFVNTDCRFYYSIDGSTWTETMVGVPIKLSSTNVVANCQTKVVLGSSGPSISPILSKKIGTLYYRYSNHGFWYSPWLDFKEGNLFDKVKMKLYAAPNGIPFVIHIIVSADNVNWFKYSSNGGRCSTNIVPIDLNVDTNSFEYEYLFDIRDNFSGVNLARYLKICIEMGDGSQNGTTTLLINSLRCLVYEEIV